MYGWLGAWVAIMLGAVAFLKLGDPTGGHAGHVVFPDEFTLESKSAAVNRIFRIAKNDRVARMKGLSTRSRSNTWIRITGGTHEGRTGVIVW